MSCALGIFRVDECESFDVNLIANTLVPMALEQCEQCIRQESQELVYR